MFASLILTLLLLTLSSIISFHVKPSQSTLKNLQVLQSNRDKNEGNMKSPSSLAKKIRSKLFDSIPIKTMAISFAGAFLTTKRQVSAAVSDNDLELVTNKGKYTYFNMT